MNKNQIFKVISTIIIIVQIILVIAAILYVSTANKNLTEIGCERIMYQISFMYPTISLLNIAQIFVNIYWYISIFGNKFTNISISLCVMFVISLVFFFSGYSDMAIGIALLLGFETPANFNRS